MKRGYKRLLLFEIVTIILLILNNFVSSILSNYKIVLLITLLIIFKFLFGFEKDRHHIWKNITIEVLIFLLLYFILYYLLGIFVSFSNTNNYFTFNGIFKVIIPLIIIIVLKEILRYEALCKSEGSKLLVIITCITLITIDLIGKYNSNTFITTHTIFIFIALKLLPIISRNIVATYISIKSGYKPVIIYLLIIELYSYILPIIPNPSEYIYSVIEFIIPFVLLYRLSNYLKTYRDEYIIRDYHKKKFSALIIPTIIIIFLVYITSGYFHYYAIVIASGSMTPSLYKGDVVIVEKVHNNYDLLELDDIIAYKYNGIIVVHRISKIVNIEGEKIFYTKGDANNSIDNYKITKDMIIGEVNKKVPYIGYPTVWLKKI